VNVLYDVFVEINDLKTYIETSLVLFQLILCGNNSICVPTAGAQAFLMDYT
jgi:hypothetical protein